MSLGATSPDAIRQASAQWQIIWCADIVPQRRALSGRTGLSRRTISSRHSSRASVFMASVPGGGAEQALAAGLAERGQRAGAARFRRGEQRLEARIAAQRVELRPRVSVGATK